MKISDHSAELIISLYRRISHLEDIEQKDELGRLYQLLRLPCKLKENLNDALNQDQSKLFEHRIDAMINQSQHFTKSTIKIEPFEFEQLINTLRLIDSELNELKKEINKGL